MQVKVNVMRFNKKNSNREYFLPLLEMINKSSFKKIIELSLHTGPVIHDLIKQCDLSINGCRVFKLDLLKWGNSAVPAFLDTSLHEG